MVRKRNGFGRINFLEQTVVNPTQAMVISTLFSNNADPQDLVTQELSRPIWMSENKLSRKKILHLHRLLRLVDTPTLLSFTVALGWLVLSEQCKAERMKFEKKLSVKIKQRRVKKKKRLGKSGKLRARMRLNKWKDRIKIVIGFQMRHVLGSRFRMIVRRKVTRQYVKVDVGSLMYRLLMATKFLSCGDRNVYITSKWELSAIRFVHNVYGFWGTIAFEEGVSYLISSAMMYGMYVVPSNHLERLESGFECSCSDFPYNPMIV